MHDPMQSAASPAGRGTRNRQHTDAERHPQGTGPTLFDAVTEPDAETLKAAGQAVALHASDVRWKAAAETAIVELARSGREFTAEDVRRRVGVLASSPQALGALFSAAAKAGIIRAVGFTVATRPERHGGVLRTWVGAGEVSA
jgi:hypothetical protein